MFPRVLELILSFYKEAQKKMFSISFYYVLDTGSCGKTKTPSEG